MTKRRVVHHLHGQPGIGRHDVGPLVRIVSGEYPSKRRTMPRGTRPEQLRPYERGVQFEVPRAPLLLRGTVRVRATSDGGIPHTAASRSDTFDSETRCESAWRSRHPRAPAGRWSDNTRRDRCRPPPRHGAGAGPWEMLGNHIAHVRLGRGRTSRNLSTCPSPFRRTRRAPACPRGNRRSDRRAPERTPVPADGRTSFRNRPLPIQATFGGSRLPSRAPQRIVAKQARSSATNVSGCSNAAKWPPVSRTL